MEWRTLIITQSNMDSLLDGKLFELYLKISRLKINFKTFPYKCAYDL